MADSKNKVPVEVTERPDEMARAVERFESARAATPGREHLQNIVKAVAATAPFSGGIASLMSDYLPNERQRRLEELVLALIDDFERLKERVRPDRTGEGFVLLFERTAQATFETPEQSKRDAFRAILVNSTLTSDVSQEEADYFLHVVSSLTDLHFRVLRFLGDPVGYLDAVGIERARIQGSFSTFMPVALPGASLDVIRSAWGDLHSRGLLSGPWVAAMTSAQGLDLARNRLTALGKRLVESCSQP